MTSNESRGDSTFDQMTIISEDVPINEDVPASICPSYLSSWRLAVVTFSLCLGTFLVALDVNIIGVAIPRITTVFDSLGDVSWYAAAYLLTVTALQPTMGFLYKSFNVRLVYFSSVIIFEVGSVLCAAAPDSITFIIGRAIAGIGAAGLIQGALAIIALIVELERRPLFMGIVISVFGLSICVGPVIGGAFVDRLSWRWCFSINLPIGGIAMVFLILYLRIRGIPSENRDLSTMTKLRRMDLLGTIAFIGAICCVVLALQWGGQTKPWCSPTIISLLVGFLTLISLFAGIQYKRGDDALIPLRVLRQRSILVGCMFLFFIGIFMYIYSFYIPFYFQAVRDVSPVKSGVRIIPFVLAQMVFIGVAGFVVTRWGVYVPYMIAGGMINIVGAALVTALNVNTTTVQWASFLVVAGIGLGISMQLPYTAVQIVLSEVDVPTGNGGIISIPIAQSLFLSTLRDQVKDRLPGVNPEMVVAVGAANLHMISGSNDQILLALQQAYAMAVSRPFILALAGVTCATMCTPFMEWKNLKREAAARKISEKIDNHGTESC